MKIVVQRVKHASVTVNKKIVGKINEGFMVLLGVTHSDTKKEADYLVKKLCNLRVFEDENGKMNLSLKDVNGDCSDGNRPSFTNSAKPEMANELYEYFVEECKKQIPKVETGIFREHMEVELLNNGPVTIIIEK